MHRLEFVRITSAENERGLRQVGQSGNSPPSYMVVFLLLLPRFQHHRLFPASIALLAGGGWVVDKQMSASGRGTLLESDLGT